MYSKSTEPHVKTISDSVYYTLRKNIIELNLKPGTSISIKSIADELGVSRSPVRDAVIKLGKEGLIDSIPQSSTMVSKIDLSRVDEERFLRETLEEKTLLLFLETYKEKDTNLLKERIRQQRTFLGQGKYGEFLNWDDLFHEVFFQVTRKEICWDLIKSMSGHYRRVRFMSLWDDSMMLHLIEEHETILKCLINRDEIGTTSILKKHCSQQENEEKILRKKYPDYFSISKKEKGDGEESYLRKDFLFISR